MSSTIQPDSLQQRHTNKPAFIVIDMLNEFLDRWPAADRARLLRSTLELLSLLRSRQVPVLWVRQEFEADLSDALLEVRQKGIRSTIRGTPGCEIVPELKPADGERVLVKKRYSAFFGTDLDQVLAELQPDALILAGVNTHACIRTTAIDAYQRDWPVILALDCIGSYDKEHHDVSVRYMRDKIARVMTNTQIADALQY
jgi:nicotinamidase-related amidase